MEDGLFHVPVADVLDIGDRILQWGSLRILMDRNELRNFSPSLQRVRVTVPVADLIQRLGEVIRTPLNRESNVIPKQTHHAVLRQLIRNVVQITKGPTKSKTIHELGWR